MRKIKLFCFPYAGGSAVLYKKWKQFLANEIELRPVELAGRGRRMQEKLYNDMPEAVNDVFNLIKDEIRQSPYALFGHSMGGLLAYQLAQKIRDNQLAPPLHIFFSGRSAPHIERSDDKKYHLMSDEVFRNEVIELGGTPPEFFEHPELLDLFLPLLKNDFRITEAAIPDEQVRPLDGNITVFLGKEDDLTADQCDGWKKHTRQLCTLHYFEGGHFFLLNETEQIVKHINKTLLELFTYKAKNLELI